MSDQSGTDTTLVATGRVIPRQRIQCKRPSLPRTAEIPGQPLLVATLLNIHSPTTSPTLPRPGRQRTRLVRNSAADNGDCDVRVISGSSTLLLAPVKRPRWRVADAAPMLGPEPGAAPDPATTSPEDQLRWLAKCR
jgi:hypothetical protein